MLYIPSFRFSFSDSIMENKNRVIKFPFPFSWFKNRKGNIEIWSAIPIFIFHLQHQIRKNRKTTSSVHAVYCFPVWCHSVGKTNEEPNHPLFIFRLAIIRKHKWDVCPPDVLWYLCSLYKTLTKRKTFVWSMLPLLRSETVIRKRESPPVHASFTA